MTIKIAFLSGFTIRGIKEELTAACDEQGIHTEIREGGYNQYVPDILDENSWLYEFNPDLVFLFTDLRVLFKDKFYALRSGQTTDWDDGDIYNQYRSLIDTYLRRTQNGKIILFTISPPSYDPHGIAGDKYESLSDRIGMFNMALRHAYKRESRVHFFDFERFLRKHGECHVFDYRKYFLWDFHINPEYYHFLCNDLLGFIYPALGLTKKVIALDLDNTLWGGIIGEDDYQNIQLGPTSPGNAYVEFQRYLKMLYDRGVLLVINSKNNPEDALQVIREHPSMVLREEQFAAMRINWNDKARNMQELAEELNISLDTFVFIDDDQVNCHLIRQQLPEVQVVFLPEDPSFYVCMLMNLFCFNNFQVTEDDQKRGVLYTQERQRKQVKESFDSLASYLKSLKMKIQMLPATDALIPRISQLTMKTNQFNLTTKRYTEEDIKQFIEQGDILYAVQASDRYGGYGTVGVVRIKQIEKRWEIDTFLLSCRVIGRGIEKAILHHVIEQARNKGIILVVGEYINSGKNQVCAAMYPDNGFIAVPCQTGLFYEYFPLDGSLPTIDYIEVN